MEWILVFISAVFSIVMYLWKKRNDKKVLAGYATIERLADKGREMKAAIGDANTTMDKLVVLGGYFTPENIKKAAEDIQKIYGVAEDVKKDLKKYKGKRIL